MERAVAKEIEGMTKEETLAYFDRTAVRQRFKAALRRAKQPDKTTPKKGKKMIAGDRYLLLICATAATGVYPSERKPTDARGR